MTRTHSLLCAMTLLLSLLPAPSSAASRTSSFAFNDDNFSWAIFSYHEHVQFLNGYTTIEDLKKQYGDEFLYVRDGTREYVIKDKGIIDRARRTGAKVADYSAEIGEVAVDDRARDAGLARDRLDRDRVEAVAGHDRLGHVEQLLPPLLRTQAPHVCRTCRSHRTEVTVV